MAHPTSYLMAIGGSSSGINGPGREGVHSSSSSVEVKNSCNYTSTLCTYLWRGASYGTVIRLSAALKDVIKAFKECKLFSLLPGELEFGLIYNLFRYSCGP
jgi:hypothetical protein